MQAIDLNPSDGKPYALLGQIRINRQQWQSAGEWFEKAYEKGDRSEGMYVGFAQVALAIGDDKSFKKIIEEALEQYPDSSAIQALNTQNRGSKKP